MSNPLGLPPPPGGNETKAPSLVISGVVITVIAFITVVLRMYARAVIVRKVGWDDHTIVLAMAMSIVSLALTIDCVRHGLGHHLYYVSTVEDIAVIGLQYHVIEIFYNLATAIIKISACLCVLRILARATSKLIHWFLYGLMMSTLAVCVATAFVILFQCKPVQSVWDPKVPGRCLPLPSLLGVGYAQNAWSIITDIACTFLPIIVIRKLKINSRAKVALYVVMSLGLFSSASCIVKMYYFYDLTKGDFTWNGVEVNKWAIVEQNVGIIACSIAPLQPLFKKYFDTRTSSSRPGARITAVFSTWKESISKAFSSRGSRSRTFHNIQNDAGSESGERILPEDEARRKKDDGIVMRTDVELFYTETGKGIEGGVSRVDPNSDESR